jgi:transposase-like protein
MILNALVERLKRRSKGDFKGRHFEASLILQAVSWYLRYPLSYRDIEEMLRERVRSRSVPSGRVANSHVGRRMGQTGLAFMLC